MEIEFITEKKGQNVTNYADRDGSVGIAAPGMEYRCRPALGFIQPCV
jgi:hypothetical protein